MSTTARETMSARATQIRPAGRVSHACAVPNEAMALVDSEDWTRHLAELEALCQNHPELFAEADQAASKQVDAVAEPPKPLQIDQLRMKLEILTQWHERRAKALQAATIQLFVRQHRARCS